MNETDCPGEEKPGSFEIYTPSVNCVYPLFKMSVGESLDNRDAIRDNAVIGKIRKLLRSFISEMDSFDLIVSETAYIKYQ